MTLEEFQHEIFECAFNSPLCDIPVVRRISPTSINIRTALTFGNFVDVFFNEETGTTAFALIEKGDRIFGIDNTGGWHLHPFERPEAHTILGKPMSFAEFLDLIAKYYQ